MIDPFASQHADAWAEDFVDVESLNAEVSDPVRGALLAVRDADHSRVPMSSSYLVLGTAGTGKTHLFARLRRQLGKRAAFVLIRPELGVKVQSQHILAAVLDALSNKVLSSRGERQLDVVLGSALAIGMGRDAKWSQATLDELRAMEEVDRENAIVDAVDALEEQYEGVDGSWAELLLRTPFMKRASRRAAMRWLSGREPNERELKRIGYQHPMDPSMVMPALRTMGSLASLGAPILLVFDQLENLHDDNDTTRVLAHASLVTELFDEVRGLVLVQMALDAEWGPHISPLLSQSQRSRLEANVLYTRSPSAAEREELLRKTLERVAESERGEFPWPFSPETWEGILAQRGLTPRILLASARAAQRGEGTGGSNPSEPGAAPGGSDSSDDEATELRLEHIFAEQREQSATEYRRTNEELGAIDPARLHGALFALASLDEAMRVRSAKRSARHDLELAYQTGESRPVYGLQHAHHRAVGARLKDATERARQRPLVMRDSALPIRASWKKVSEQARKFTEQVPDGFIWLQPKEVIDLLALHDLLSAARSRDLAGADGEPFAEADVRAWARTLVAAEGWRLPRVMRGESALVSAEGEEPDHRTTGETSEGSSGLPNPVATSGPPLASSTAEPSRTEPPEREPPDLDPSAGALGLLEELHLASIPRLLTELRKHRGDLSRAELEAELVRSGRVRRFGRELVWLRARRGGEER